MTPDEFKSQLAPMVAANRNNEAVAFVKANLASVRAHMTAEDRMMVADWMEGVVMALDLGISDEGAANIAPTSPWPSGARTRS